MGLIPELMKLGVKLLLADTQQDDVHFSDSIFLRDGLPFTPIAEAQAAVVRCAESRRFLKEIGIDGEIISTPSHSRDSVTLILDGGECFVGDLEPYAYLDAYPRVCPLREDWENILRHHPRSILYAHANEKTLERKENEQL